MPAKNPAALRGMRAGTEEGEEGGPKADAITRPLRTITKRDVIAV